MSGASHQERPGVVQRLRAHVTDAALMLAALVFGWVTLTYPFGRDQGLYYYVGREWALRGAIPYRDVFDHKTPGIYIIHAISVLAFGEHYWGIRILELLCILWLGWSAANVATPRGQTPMQGLRGLSCFAGSLLYFGFFDFRETGEGEIWLATAAIASAAVVLHGSSERRAQVISGLLCGAAVLMKPSAMVFEVLVVLLLLLRVREEKSQRVKRSLWALLAFGGAAAVVPAIAFAYFGLHGALHDFYDIVVKANSDYIRHESDSMSPGTLAHHTGLFYIHYHPLSTLGLLALIAVAAWARKKKQRERLRRHGIGVAFCIAGYLTVVMQWKFFLGHWGAFIPAATVVCVNLAVDLIAVLRARSWPTGRAAAASALVLLGLYGLTGDKVGRYSDINLAAIGWLKGSVTRDEFMDHFVEHGWAAGARDNEKAGIWLREHTRESDVIAVRGFQPQVYAAARRRYPGRFFWSTFIVSDTRMYKRQEWVEEDRKALSSNPPRFVVTLTQARDTTDSSDWWLPRGYSKELELGDFTILARTPGVETNF